MLRPWRRLGIGRWRSAWSCGGGEFGAGSDAAARIQTDGSWTPRAMPPARWSPRNGGGQRVRRARGEYGQGRCLRSPFHLDGTFWILPSFAMLDCFFVLKFAYSVKFAVKFAMPSNLGGKNEREKSKWTNIVWIIWLINFSLHRSHCHVNDFPYGVHATMEKLPFISILVRTTFFLKFKLFYYNENKCCVHFTLWICEKALLQVP